MVIPHSGAISFAQIPRHIKARSSSLRASCRHLTPGSVSNLTSKYIIYIRDCADGWAVRYLIVASTVPEGYWEYIGAEVSSSARPLVHA